MGGRILKNTLRFSGRLIVEESVLAFSALLGFCEISVAKMSREREGKESGSRKGMADEGVGRAFRGGLRRMVTVAGHGGGDFISIFHDCNWEEPLAIWI